MVLCHESTSPGNGELCRWVPNVQGKNAHALEVVITRLDLAPRGVSRAAALLSETEWQRARRFSFEGDRRRFIASRACLRQLLGQRLKVNPNTIELVCGSRGKPELGGHFAGSDIHFNVSHSSDVAAYAFATGREIGIDIEALRTINAADEIVNNCFSRCEQLEYHSLTLKDKPHGFFNGWTRKEAFIKATGNGLYQPFDSFDVSLTPGKPAEIRRVGLTPGEDCGWLLHSFTPVPGLIAALAVQDDGNPYLR